MLDCLHGCDHVAKPSVGNDETMPHEVHVSERRSFRGCRRRWNWAYREGYVPESPIKALEFGIAYHKALEEFYEPESWLHTSAEVKRNNAIFVFTMECEKQRAKYLASTRTDRLPDEVTQDYDERVALGTGMLEYHADFVHPKFDGWFKPIAVEISFEVPIWNPDNPETMLHCLSSPDCGQAHSNDPNNTDSRVVYAGRVDMLVEDLRHGGYFIWDHKTASQLAGDDGFLQLDDQVGSYAWALKSILGLDIRGFIYAESRKDYPREPKQLKRGGGGRSFSTAKNQPTSLEIFEPFVMQHDRLAYDDGAYDEYIAYLKSNEATQFHQRFNVIKSEVELHSIGRNIALEAADMVDPSLRVYPSVGRYTCSTCAFRQPCLASNMGEDVDYLLETQYKQTNRKYWQDQPSNSDKGGK